MKSFGKSKKKNQSSPFLSFSLSLFASWHEIGVYDLPATIDYILEQTNQTKLAYAGVSQGGAVILVTLSEKPQYNKKIIVAQLMAPAVILKHFRAPFPKSVDLMNLFGVGYFFPLKSLEFRIIKSNLE